MRELVRIRYWEQEAMESGGWMLTEPMSQSTAEKLIEARVYEQAEIVSDDMRSSEFNSNIHD